MVGRILHLVTRPAFLVAAGALGLVWLTWLVFFKWDNHNVVTEKQEKLFTLLEKKKWRGCGPLLSERYLDQWEFNKADALLALEDVGKQFFILDIEPKEMEITVEGDTGAASARLRLSGSGSPFCQIVAAEANRLQAPFIFRWEKESWTPWSWRLVRIENADLNDLRGYEPGDLSRALSNPAGLEP